MKAADLAVQRFAANHHGVLSRAELLALGFSEWDIRRRRSSGMLERIHPHVYRLAGAPKTCFSRWRGAVLYGGDGSMLCCRSAGAALQLDGVQDPGEVEIFVRNGTVRTGVIAKRLSEGDVPRIVNVQGIPVTATERTILDLAGVCEPSRVGLALDDALRRRLTTIERLWVHLHDQGGRGRKGTSALRKMLQARDAGMLGILSSGVLSKLRCAGF